MTEFEFVDELPPKLIRNTPRDHLTALVLLEDFAAALKARPGVWAVWPLPDQIRPTTDIKHGRPKAFRGGRFDAERRNGVLYVRYQGRGAGDGQV